MVNYRTRVLTSCNTLVHDTPFRSVTCLNPATVRDVERKKTGFLISHALSRNVPATFCGRHLVNNPYISTSREITFPYNKCDSISLLQTRTEYQHPGVFVLCHDQTNGRYDRQTETITLRSAVHYVLR